MTPESYLKLAEQAGFTLNHKATLDPDIYLSDAESITRFAQAVTNAEREACALVCLNNAAAENELAHACKEVKDFADKLTHKHLESAHRVDAQAIRQRGEETK